MKAPNALPHVVHVECSAGVDDVDAGCAVGLHQLGLLGELPGRRHVAHHQEAHRLHTQLACIFQMLARNIRFGTVGRHAHDAGARVAGLPQIVRGADTGQQQRGNPGLLHRLGDGRDPLQVGVRTESVVETGPFETIAVRYFDAVDTSRVQRRGDRLHLGDAVLMADGVAAIAQRYVRDVELPAHVDTPWWFGEAHAGCFRPRAMPTSIRRRAIMSPHARAAEVMMSRLPA